MPALDQCHNQVVRALEKANWIVSPHAYTIAIQKGHVLHIDIEAHRADSLNGHIIIVEVKCFAEGNADTNEMYKAIGQYLVYRSWLKSKGLADSLYLAVPKAAYERIFSRMGMTTVTENTIKMIVVDLDREEIISWLV